MKNKILSAIAAVMVTASLVAIPASAKTVNPGVIRRPNDFLTYNYTASGDYTKFYCYPNYSAETATISGYDGSFKSTTYLIQGRTGPNNYYTIVGDTDSGAKKTALISLTYDTSAAARRYATAYCCLTSGSSSGIVDSYTVDIRKSTSG